VKNVVVMVLLPIGIAMGLARGMRERAVQNADIQDPRGGAVASFSAKSILIPRKALASRPFACLR
jgi:hypothetical protein